MKINFENISKASLLLNGKVKKTPTIEALSLGKHLGCNLFLKLENLQITSSFKVRGAFIAINNLTKENKSKGVIAMSAGNHAQAVAYHAKNLGIKSTIIMPEQAPFSKVTRTRELGAEVILRGRTLNESAQFVSKLCKEKGYSLIHPYDDPNTVIGQGTIGIEILNDFSNLDFLLIPIGGGGLASGIAIAVKHLNPKIKIIGVESKLFPSNFNLFNSLNEPFGGETLADGIAVKFPGEITSPIIQKYIDQILLVDEFSIENSISALFEHERIVSEGAGAAGIAAIIQNMNLFHNKNIGSVICGGNIDSRIFAGILNRKLARDGRIQKIRIDITDEPGMLAKISNCIAQNGGNIIEIYHQRMFHDVPMKEAKIDAIIEALSINHINKIISSLIALGFKVRTISDSSY